jgi:anti-sigma-K factor RskA
MLLPSDQLEQLIAGYVLGDLSPEEAAEFERLLAENPAIATEIAQMQTALELAYAPPELSPPSSLRSAILEQAFLETNLDSENLNPGNLNPDNLNPGNLNPASLEPTPSSELQAPSPSAAKIQPLRNQNFPWRRVFDVAAAALILTLGIQNYRLRQTLQAAQSTPQYTILTYVLQPTQAESEALVRVEVNPNTLEATLVAENLPPLPPNQVYAVWTVLEPNAPFTTDDKNAILTEVFRVDEQGSFSQTVTVPEAFRFGNVVTNVAVSIEDAAAPQLHQGSPVVIAEPL